MKRIAKMQRWFIPGMVISVVAVLVGLFVIALHFQNILIDPDRSPGTTVWDLAQEGLVIVLVLFMIRKNLQWRRELRTLGQDTYRCIEFLIRRVNDDIRAVRRDDPFFLLAFFVLVFLSDWVSAQSDLHTASGGYSLGLLACVYSLLWVH